MENLTIVALTGQIKSSGLNGQGAYLYLGLNIWNLLKVPNTVLPPYSLRVVKGDENGQGEGAKNRILCNTFYEQTVWGEWEYLLPKVSYPGWATLPSG